MHTHFGRLDNLLKMLYQQPAPLHILPSEAPFLLFSADKDLPLLPGMAEDFHKALLKQGCQSRLVRVDNRNHNSIMFKAIEPHDPVARAMLDFIKQKTADASLR